MARPLMIDGKLPMKIFVDNGYRYAVTRTSVRKPDGKYNHPQKIWGTVDDKLNFHPNARYLALSAQEKAEMLMPSEWRLQSPDSQDHGQTPRRGRPSYSGESSSLLYGHTWFLDMLADRSGLRDDLVHVFGGRDMADNVLTMAFFSLLGSSSFSHLASEQRTTWFPSDSPIESWDASRLTASITEDDKQALFRCRKARTDATSWLGIDSTSFTHYGKALADSKRGKNKEHDHADQVNVLVLYDITDGSPVYYRQMPGNMPDTRSMRVTLDEFRANGFGNVNLVLDRGYVSEEVVSMLAKGRHPFVMMAKTGDAQIARAIRETNYEEMTSHRHWIDRHGVFGKVLDYKFKVAAKGGSRDVDTMRACLFFDPERQGETRKEIHRMVSEMAAQLENMKKDREAVDADTLAKYSRYFDIVLTRGRHIKSYAMNEKNMEADADRTGYFAILTNCMSPSRHELSEILDIYGMRDEQEKSFMFIKSEQDGRRLRTSRDGNANGRLFIQFVALVLNCIIYRKFFASKELQKLFPTRQHMLEELRSIRLIRHPLRAKIITEVVGRQVDVFKEFKLPVPAKLLPKERRKEFADALEQTT